MEFALRIQIN